LQRLHRPEAASHHGGKRIDAEPVGEPDLSVDPVLDRDDRKRRAVRLARFGIHAFGPVEPKQPPTLFDADHEELSVSRACRDRSCCPPADIVRVVRVVAGHVVRGVSAWQASTAFDLAAFSVP